MATIEWSLNAVNELASTLDYLKRHFTPKEIAALQRAIEQTERIITENPLTFNTVPENEHVRKVVVLKLNTMYYTVSKDADKVYILSFFSNRQHPQKRKL